MGIAEGRGGILGGGERNGSLQWKMFKILNENYCLGRLFEKMYLSKF